MPQSLRSSCALLLLALSLLAPCRLWATDNPTSRTVPGMMLASPWPDRPPPVTELLVSEKLDGVRARWDGRTLRTRGGHTINAPAGFTHDWPTEPMDGELWAGRGRFDATSALVRRGNPADPGWKSLRFHAFDLPAHPGSFEQRHAALATLLSRHRTPHLALVAQERLTDAVALQERLQQILAAGGEGLIAHHRHNRYMAGRSPLLFKLKPFADAEARVVAHLPGKGKYTGLTGALQVRDAQGRIFRVGSGLSDAQRRAPPPVGSTITYRYTERTAKGLPRFPRFVRVRDEEPVTGKPP